MCGSNELNENEWQIIMIRVVGHWGEANQTCYPEKCLKHDIQTVLQLLVSTTQFTRQETDMEDKCNANL